MVKCEVCGKEFEQITYTHLQTHGMTVKDYKQKFPGAELRNDCVTAKISGENNPMKRPKVRKKATQSLKEYYKTHDSPRKGAEMSEENKRKLSERMKGENNPAKQPEVGKKIAESMKGENNPNYGKEPWNKGLTKEDDLRVAKISETEKKFYKDHDPWNKGLTKEEDPRVARQGAKGDNHPAKRDKLRERISKSLKEYYRNHKHPWSGRHHTEEAKRKNSKSTKEYWKNHKHPNKGRKFPEEYCKERSKIAEKLWQDPEYRKEVTKKLVMAARKRPTGPEREIINVCDRNDFPFRYVGDGKIIINGHNPDFIHKNNRKLIIEVFGDYWHSEERTGNTREKEEKERKEIFSEKGYRTLILWQNEINNSIQEEIANRIRQFLELEPKQKYKDLDEVFG